ncbi:MAG: NAD-dependent epimerase/dehydratase family protein [Thermodesulfobacteriota bacterium]
MKKILVTGGAGYIGSVVVRELLKEGHKVRVIDNLIYGGLSLLGFWNEKKFEFIFGDITNKNDCDRALEGVAIVIHLAAIVGDKACFLNQDLAKKVNLESTCILADLAKKKSVRRFIFVSTCSNYGISDPSKYVTEEDLLKPVSLYAETKVQAERYILDQKDVIFCPTVLRLATVYGVSPRMRFDLLINEFVRDALKKHKLVVYGKQFWRPYIHVKDVAGAIKEIIRSPESITKGEIYNVGDTSQNFQKKMIAEMIKNRLPRTNLEYIKKEEDPRSYKVSFEKIKNGLGFKTTKTVKDGINEIIQVLSQNVINDFNTKKYTNSLKLS